MVPINGSLGVVALKPALRSLEDVAVWIGEFALDLRPGVAGHISGELADRHGRRLSFCSTNR
jgi:hypothetical protein